MNALPSTWWGSNDDDDVHDVHDVHDGGGDYVYCMIIAMMTLFTHHTNTMQTPCNTETQNTNTIHEHNTKTLPIPPMWRAHTPTLSISPTPPNQAPAVPVAWPLGALVAPTGGLRNYRGRSHACA